MPFPGTIDSDYNGCLRVILVNQSSEKDFQINVGDRIAQLLILKLLHPVRLIQVERLDSAATSARGSVGFGSTNSKLD